MQLSLSVWCIPLKVIHLKHTAAATADVDDRNVGGIGEGFG